MLSRLRRDGMVDSTWRESKAGPPRRYYRLTNRGASAVRSFSDQWEMFRDAVDNVLKKDV
jgi:PadR family transcriptional regulator PadR